MSKWHKVTEKLPNDKESVWCFGTHEGYDDERFSFEGYYDWSRGRWWADNNGDYVDGGYGQEYRANVTHWMHLPEPPEDE